MPIRGLTDRRAPAFPRLGKLRKGAPKPEDGKRPGRELPHWRFVPANGYPELLDAFERRYGEKPTELDVYLPYGDIEANFATWKEAWSAGGLQHRCDGETCTAWLQEDGTYSQEPIPCPGGCKEVGRLTVILTGLFREGYIGYVTMETHSLNDLMSIMSSLQATVEARGTEDLRGIGFCLRRVQREISTPTTSGKRARRKKWLVELVPAQRWVLAQLEAAQRRAMPELAAGDVDDDDGEDWDDEEVITVDPTTGAIVSDKLEPEPEFQSERPAMRKRPPRPDPPKPIEERETPGDDKPDPDYIAGWPNWSEDKCKGFWASARKLNLTEGVVLTGFGVDDMAEYGGTVAQARVVLAALAYGVHDQAIGVAGLSEALGGRIVATAVAEGMTLDQIKAAVGDYIEAKTGEPAPAGEQRTLI